MDIESNKKLIENCAKNNPLYNFFNDNSFWEDCSVELNKTPWRNKESENSVVFGDPENYNEKAKAELIKKIFGIDNGTFADKFEEAVHGGGNEIRRILTLHSSSLLALLSFYKVSERNRITIPIGKSKNLIFNQVHFEKENQVTYAYKLENNPDLPKSYSNVDITLEGKDENNKQIVLFLESKFSEYLKNGKVTNLNNDLYGGIYSDLEGFLKSNKLIYADSKTEAGKLSATKELRAANGRTNAYLGGIKQMISHFMGVCEYASDPKHADEEIYLGSILYKFGIPIDDKKHFDDYSDLYTALMKALKNINEKYKKCLNVHLLPEVLTYQNIFKEQNKDFLDKKVAKFYKLETSNTLGR